MRLTEWEMAKLRKRMKKNAVWSPSETMIRRELADRGRGPECYRAAKARAEFTSEEFVDDDKIATTAPGKILAPGEISADSLGMEELQLSNRGMKLNEAKKLKKENLAREQAAQAAIEAEQAATRLGVVGSVISNLFSPRTDDVGESVVVNAAKDKGKEVAKSPARKRKRDTTPKHEDSQAEPGISTSPTNPTPKKRKVATPAPVITTTTTTTTSIPLAAAGHSSRASTPAMPSPTETKRSAAAATNKSRRPSIAPKAPSPDIALASRPPSRQRPPSTTSVEPPSTSTRDRARRASTASVPAREPTPARLSARRSKRPAPGPVTSSQDGGAAVSVGRRKAAPRKRGGGLAGKKPKEEEEEMRVDEETAGEEIDPDEPRYCLCGDVSFGTMICCENSDVCLSPFSYRCSYLFISLSARWSLADNKVIRHSASGNGSTSNASASANRPAGQRSGIVPTAGRNWESARKDRPLSRGGRSEWSVGWSMGYGRIRVRSSLRVYCRVWVYGGGRQ